MVHWENKNRLSCDHEIIKEIIQENFQIEGAHQYPTSIMNDKRLTQIHTTDKYSATRYKKTILKVSGEERKYN